MHPAVPQARSRRREAPFREEAAPKKKPQRAPATQILSPFARDTLGIGLMVLAGLAVLSVWFDAAGPMGDAFSRLPHGLRARGRAVSARRARWGIALLRDRSPEERMRMFIGFVIMGLGVLGLVSIVRGNPGVFAPAVDTKVRGAGVTQGFSDAGRFFGTLGASPLESDVACGAALVDLGLAVIGTLIMTGTRSPSSGGMSQAPGVARREVRGEARRRAGEGGGEAREAAPQGRARHGESREGVQGEADGAARPHRAGGRAAGIRGARTLDLPPDADDEASGSTSAPTKARGRTITTADGPYRLPPLDLLRTAPPSTNDGVHEKDIMEALGHTLSTFGVDARVTAAHRGPTVTMYEVAVASGTKVNKVLNLSSDIAYALATPDVRIIAPIPGKSAIGIEVPNRHRDFVMLGDILRSRAAKQATHPLQVALGKDIHGESQMVNLATMPHVLIAGATGAGKSSPSTASSRRS